MSMTVKLDLSHKDGAFGKGESVYVHCTTTWHPTGFTHHARTVMPPSLGVGEAHGRAFWCNRTWESFHYQTALHDLCDEIARNVFKIPTRKAFRTAKYAESARNYADTLKKRIDCYR